MPIVNVSEAKTQLSRLLTQVQEGMEVVISRLGQPVARLVRCKSAGKRQFGAMKGKIAITGASSPRSAMSLRSSAKSSTIAVRWLQSWWQESRNSVPGKPGAVHRLCGLAHRVMRRTT